MSEEETRRADLSERELVVQTCRADLSGRKLVGELVGEIVKCEYVEKKCEIKEIAFIQRQLMSKSKRQLE